jgi:P27 family predicted phage terminase small subunit
MKIFNGSRVRGAASEPKPEIGSKIPDPPKWLGARGKAEWRHIAPLVYKVGCLTDVDVTALAVYCQAVDDYLTAVEHIRKNGWTTVSDRGNMIVNPMTKIMRESRAAIKDFGDKFGITPSSRVGLNGPPQDEGFDDLESFKRGVS